MDVVAAVLSKDGYQKVVDIMDGDQTLVRGGRAMFGKPSETQPWMVQFGGHHLGVNVTVIGKHFVLTPTHTGRSRPSSSATARTCARSASKTTPRSSW